MMSKFLRPKKKKTKKPNKSSLKKTKEMYKYYILIYKKINVWKYLYNYLKFKSIFRGETTVCNILANVLHNAWNYTNLNNIQFNFKDIS